MYLGPGSIDIAESGGEWGWGASAQTEPCPQVLSGSDSSSRRELERHDHSSVSKLSPRTSSCIRSCNPSSRSICITRKRDVSHDPTEPGTARSSSGIHPRHIYTENDRTDGVSTIHT